MHWIIFKKNSLKKLNAWLCQNGIWFIALCHGMRSAVTIVNTTAQAASNRHSFDAIYMKNRRRTMFLKYDLNTLNVYFVSGEKLTSRRLESNRVFLDLHSNVIATTLHYKVPSTFNAKQIFNVCDSFLNVNVAMRFHFGGLQQSIANTHMNEIMSMFRRIKTFSTIRPVLKLTKSSVTDKIVFKPTGWSMLSNDEFRYHPNHQSW